LIENFRNLGTDLIDFILGSEFKDVWHDMTSYSTKRPKQTPVRGPAPQIYAPSGANTSEA